MDLLTILLIAIALAVDAFAVSLAAGVSLCTVSNRQVFRIAFHFGLFQAMMNILGWAAGLTVRQLIESIDHWLAFCLLAVVALKMMYDGIKGNDTETPRVDPTRGGTLIMLSVATSIDSLAVGLGFSILKMSIWFPALVIGLVASFLSTVGMRLGCRLGSATRLGSWSEIGGGMVLLGIGTNILFQHGVFG